MLASTSSSAPSAVAGQYRRYTDISARLSGRVQELREGEEKRQLELSKQPVPSPQPAEQQQGVHEVET